MKKNITLLIIHYLLLINFAFSQSGWILQSPLPTNKHLNAVKYLSKDTIITVGGLWRYQEILKSYNNGDSWVRKYTASSNCLFDLCFLNSNTGFAVGDSNYIIKTTNAGENWFSINSFNSLGSNIAVFFVNSDIGYVYNDSGKVLKTTNCGQNWIAYKVASFNPSWPNKMFFINENTGYLTSGNYYFITTNGGVNWTFYQFEISGGYNSIYFINELTGFVAGYFGRMGKTTNGGINWFSIPIIVGTDLSSIKFINDNTGYIGGGYNVLKTTNQGLNWTDYYIYCGIRNIDIDSYGNGMGVGVVGKIVRTTNSGNNWEITSSGTIYNLFTLSMVNSNTGYSFGTFGEVLKTTNGGINWNLLNCNTEYEIMYSKFFDENTGIATSRFYLHQTSDGGKNWISKNAPDNNISGISFLNQISGFVISSNKLMKTTDLGDNWTQIYDLGNTGQNVLFFYNSNIGYTGGEKGVMYKTTNAGYNWTYLNTGIGSYFDIKSIYFTDSLCGYASYNYNNILSKTTNGGINWINKSFPDMWNVQSMCFVNNNTGYIAMLNNPYSVMKTTNEGSNWMLQYTGDYSLRSIAFVDSITGYASGDNGVILKTTNGGAVWVSNNGQEIPKSIELFQNYPNPFNPSTNIKYHITNSSYIILKVYDILGKEIATLVNEKQKPGIYEVKFDGSNFASGIYFYRIQTNDFMQVKKMIMIK